MPWPRAKAAAAPVRRRHTQTRCTARAANAQGNTKTGLIELISAYTGIGFARVWQTRTSARPPVREPMKPTAITPSSARSAIQLKPPFLELGELCHCFISTGRADAESTEQLNHVPRPPEHAGHQ